MLNQQEIQRIHSSVCGVVGIELPFEITVEQAEGLKVTLKNGKAKIAAEGLNALGRGFFLLCRAVKEGKTELDVCEHRHIDCCGIMLDASRNAVMKVDAVKRCIDQLTALGMNMLMLYTEDTYEVPGYPYFGYLRGRYSRQELREIDDYVFERGIELIPCIQTLGHMEQFLQWNANGGMRDQTDILLIDEEKTYDFIRAAIASLRSSVRTNRIHIGMDEAHGVGLGRYLEKHGQTDRFELLRRHLERVVEICREEHFHAMMWSDMFFRLGSKTNDYYDLAADIPQQVLDNMPDVDMVYWDYYHRDEKTYDCMLTAHEHFPGKTIFAGGVWTWSGFLPQVKQTEATMLPALKVCAQHHVDTALATMWGDDGNETNQQLAFALLPIFSEACWQGADHPRSEDILAGECLTGLPREVVEAFGEFYPDEGEFRPGKGYLWGDALYPLVDLRTDTAEMVIERCEKAMKVLERYDCLECRYAFGLMDIVREKALLHQQLRPRYLAGDRAYLEGLARDTLPALCEKYEKLMRLHRELWLRDNKRNGWEVICGRYGASAARLRDAGEEIQEYLNGAIPAIAALEEEPLNAGRLMGQFYRCCITPTTNV